MPAYKKNESQTQKRVNFKFSGSSKLPRTNIFTILQFTLFLEGQILKIAVNNKKKEADQSGGSGAKTLVHPSKPCSSRKMFLT